MHVFEKAAGLARGLLKQGTDQIMGDEALVVHVCNGTDEVLQVVGTHVPSGGCTAGFVQLQPGEAGPVHFQGSGGFDAAIECSVGSERLFVGASALRVTGKRSFAVKVTSDPEESSKRFFDALPQVFFASSADAPNRTEGSKYAAVCARGECGTFAGDVDLSFGSGDAKAVPASVAVLVAGVDELPGVSGPQAWCCGSAKQKQDLAGLGPHFSLGSLDSMQQMLYAQHLQEVQPDLLGSPAFLAEMVAVSRAIPEASLCDQAFALDLLIEGFLAVGEGALGKAAAATLGPNLERWRQARPPTVEATSAIPYGEYAELGVEALQRRVDAAVSLLWAAVLVASRALKGVAASHPPGDAVSSVEPGLPPKDASVPAIATNSDILLEHLGTRDVEASSEKEASDCDIPALVKTCIDKSAKHSMRRAAVYSGLIAALPSDAGSALRRFCAWLPSEAHEFARPASGDDPSLSCRAYSASLFSNLDGGAATSPERLLRSLGEAAPAYKTMSTNSKSGEFFFFSADRSFLIKTITDHEAKVLHGMLPAYQNHLHTLPRSFIVRYAGLFHVQVPGGLSKFFTVMVSTFDPKCKIDETFDVKGSLYHRKKKEGESIGKDQDWYDSGRRLQLPDGLCRELLAVHELDAGFLMRFNVMDYSLLIGVHHLEGTSPGGSGFREGGGLWAEDSPEIYFVGLIDFLIGYSLKKEAEHLIRAAQGHEKDASCVHPSDYARRQVRFLRESVFGKSEDTLGTLGKLRISGLAADDLVNKDGLLDHSDPYVRVSVGLMSVETPVIKNNLNPRWDCELAIPINEHHKAECVELSVWDYDSVKAIRGADDELGHVKIEVSKLTSGAPLELTQAPLQGIEKGKLTAKLQLQQ